MKKAKIFTIFFTFILLFSAIGTNLTAFAVFPLPFDLYSKGVYMVNLDTNIVVAAKDPDKQFFPASTTKIMTCLVALENVKNFNDKVKCDYECFNEFSWADEYYNPNFVGASNAAIEPLQENLTYNDCLYALMLRSGCEAANILAYNISGSLEKFTDLMNETAAKIGCTNTHFSNAHGLFEEDNYTTAYDLYLITRYAIDNYPGFLKICSAVEYDMPKNESNPDGYTIQNTNRMMAADSVYYTEGVQGIKTGSMDEYILKTKDGAWDTENPKTGFCSLVTMCEKDGYKYLIVTLEAPWLDKNGDEGCTHFEDHQKLYDWAYSEFERKQIIGNNQQVSEVDVEMGKDTDKVGIVTTEDFYTLIPKSLDNTAIQQIVPTLEPFTAPVNKGEPVGDLVLKLDGETLATIPLITENDVELDKIAKYKDRIKTVLGSPGVIASFVILGVMIVAFAISKAISKRILENTEEMQRRRKLQMSPQTKNTRRR